MTIASFSRRAAVLGMVGAALSGCSLQRTAATLIPKDGGSARVANDLPYGRHPRQRFDLYAPTPRPARPAPIVVFFHGGGWDSGDKHLYPWLGRALASRGFLVAIPNYRLVPEVRFPAFVDDAAAAVAGVRAVAGRYGGHPDRIALVGHSAGAHLALLVALDPRWTESAGVPRRAIRAAAGLAGPYDFYPFDVDASRQAFGAWPRPEETQPISFADGGDPPVWLATGDADVTVRPRNSYALAERLRAAGGRATVKTYPGVGHVDIVTALAIPFRGRAPVLEDLTEFLRSTI
jgi:acetyl esterase/lipase